MKTRPFKLILICGGPSEERGISLNSARSVMDHLKNSQIEIISIYVDSQKQYHQISTSQLYSNTPADFDFKLNQTATRLTLSDFKSLLKESDLVFPVIHGAFGEDGELQAQLENFQVPFVGNSSQSCHWMFQKHQAAETLRGCGFATLPHIVLSKDQLDAKKVIEHFFEQHRLDRAIVKPTVGGSSIGVYSVRTPEEAYLRLEQIFERKLDTKAMLEPFCQGKEFTLVIFENLKGEPVALIPTEVDVSYESNQIFDFRKKYLPTNQAAYHTPPRFTLETVQNIRLQGEQIFKLFGMRDFVRLDGWVMDKGKIFFTDINPMNGLEQNSFFFRQASLIGLSHKEALEYVIKRACQRYELNYPPVEEIKSEEQKKPIYVIFGSHNSERQVSLMSGTNVWLKLLQSHQYSPIPFLFDPQGCIWKLPYSYTLNHTVEEIYANCLLTQEELDKWQNLMELIRLYLEIDAKPHLKPEQMHLKQFLEDAKNQKAFVFIAMHGGEGENGTLQLQLENFQIPHNGSNSTTSTLCMDKYLTGCFIQSLNDPEIQTIPKKSLCLMDFKNNDSSQFESLWLDLTKELRSSRLIIKPRFDGCSTGIVLLHSFSDLERYCHFLYQGISFIPPYSFENQTLPVELPLMSSGEFIVELYIETDSITIEKGVLTHHPKEGWIELTVGVLEERGVYHALSPSITIAEGSVLSLEEKFQGGTGINLTPPPLNILSTEASKKIKKLIEKTAKGLGIQNYARLDVFFNRISEIMFLIEANTLPGLTPSTVIYHQGLAEEPALTPLELLNKIITSKLNCC